MKGYKTKINGGVTIEQIERNKEKRTRGQANGRKGERNRKRNDDNDADRKSCVVEQGVGQK